MNLINILKTNNKYLEDFITRITYHSDGIEGSTLTYGETYAILYNDNSFKLQGIEPRQIYETINHKKAIEFAIKSLEDNVEINDILIKKINEIINDNIKGTQGYRKIQNFIRGVEEIPPEPNKIQNLMYYLIDNFKNYNEQDIYKRVAKFHNDFEHIHPFEDGNGRTGRILTNYELIRNGLAPIVIPKEERTKYFELLKNQNIDELSKWFKELEIFEENRIKIFQS